MTDKELERANILKKEIEDLSWFVKVCKNCWNVLKIRKPTSLRLKTIYGSLSDEVEVSAELSEKILGVIEEHVRNQEKELREL